MKILSVVAARPNFMKIAPFVRAVAAFNCRSAAARGTSSAEAEPGTSGGTEPITHVLVHTGQHYDREMSDAFFVELGIPRPDHNLGVGSGSPAYQIGMTMIEFEKVLLAERPRWVVIVGDVNATCACSIATKKHGFALAHVEAGLRSADWAMPEEINRVVADRLSDLLLVPDEMSRENLLREGANSANISLVGNIMIDTLLAERPHAAAIRVEEVVRARRVTPDGGPDEAARVSLPDNGYAVLTMHRPSNVDRREILEPLLDFVVREVCPDLPVVWPIHPRTRQQLRGFGLWDRLVSVPTLHLTDPVGYREMLALNLHARLMLTDSGGLQEECCVLGTPCLVLRRNTERPITLRQHGGVGILAGDQVAGIRAAYRELRETDRRPFVPPLWDGRTAERVLAELVARP